ncbi:hypothetical protein [Paenibacillus sp. FJAT-27812]|uniref:hypothetical protein n=1 Tax=Paenibacillus sp. FJAT-27812 TaxID=1684143 RepID=UPI0006A784B9|nr:hypothetical protein [Paenibacillus sp. FJAT-27812]
MQIQTNFEIRLIDNDGEYIIKPQSELLYPIEWIGLPNISDNDKQYYEIIKQFESSKDKFPITEYVEDCVNFIESTLIHTLKPEINVKLKEFATVPEKDSSILVHFLNQVSISQGSLPTNGQTNIFEGVKSKLAERFMGHKLTNHSLKSFVEANI